MSPFLHQKIHVVLKVCQSGEESWKGVQSDANPPDISLWNVPSNGSANRGEIIGYLQNKIYINYGPVRAGPLYEIRIWEAYAFLRDECIFWHSASLGRFVPVDYGICQGLPSDILSIYIMIYFNGQYWLYTWYFILYVKKFGGFFNICCSFMLCNTHVTCYLYRSLCMIYVISFFDTPLNLTISFVYIFSRGFKQRISSELIDIHIV